MKSKVLIAVFVVAQLASRAFAQFGGGIVFDPTQSGHAIAQIQQAQQLYTTTLQTRDTVITTYNLARQMASIMSLHGLSGTTCMPATHMEMCRPGSMRLTRAMA